MSNRLAQETSPYLLQHADNPVAWHPWDERALDLARAEQKPILLSIGYSSCHWCHVMAHESFEDEATARVMNAHFVCIKVDREERPDLDKVYQLAHQLLTQQTGGWPLTMFLDPDTQLPFFGGTYFPKAPRFQLPGFTDLLLRINEAFESRREDFTDQNAKVREILEGLNPQGSPEGTQPGRDDTELLAEARAQLAKQHDVAEGGFGNAPKFPMPNTTERLLRHWAFSNLTGNRDREALAMVMRTLTKMARGGIYDHLGGGFCRYATDNKWMIPHFEKMLYDNGQLLSLYADVLAIAPDELFEQAVVNTAGWMLREMQHPEGAFYAALDADSDGEEGKYYLWRRVEIKKLLSEEEYLIVETLYGLDKPANFEGRWNLHRYDSWRSVVERLSLDRNQADVSLGEARAKLLEEREKRVLPGLDDKILSSWNGLAIKGLAKASSVLKNSTWLSQAQRATDFIRTNMWRDGVLFATWKDGSAKYPGYLDDYANLLDGLLTLLTTQWRDHDAQFAIELGDAVLEHFHDNHNGGFYFTSHRHEALIHRPKPTADDALPPGNGVIAIALAKLGHLFGETRYLAASTDTIRWARTAMEQYPAGHCTLLTALEAELAAPTQIIIRGPETQLTPWREAATTQYSPWRQCYALPYETANLLPDYLPKLIDAEMRQKTVAYLCSGLSCSLPIESLEALKQALDA
ncbi:MAG: thioredoxin domain-containing protein [Gammaproteobacteria bacterium]|nr:thioredoxin domain-containing protein [Gammaproteobacteria bacterium]